MTRITCFGEDSAPDVPPLDCEGVDKQWWEYIKNNNTRPVPIQQMRIVARNKDARELRELRQQRIDRQGDL